MDEYIIKELLQCVNLDKLLIPTPRKNFPLNVIFAILEEYRRRITLGEYAMKQSHFPALFEFAGVIYDQGNENDRHKLKIFFDEIEALCTEKPKQENEINWDKIFEQCEKDSEKVYWEWLAENPEWLNEDLKWELERERKQKAKM